MNRPSPGDERRRTAFIQEKAGGRVVSMSKGSSGFFSAGSEFNSVRKQGLSERSSQLLENAGDLRDRLRSLKQMRRYPSHLSNPKVPWLGCKPVPRTGLHKGVCDPRSQTPTVKGVTDPFDTISLTPWHPLLKRNRTSSGCSNAGSPVICV